MKLLKFTLTIFFLFLLSINFSNAQEVIMKKDYNAVIQKYLRNHPQEKNRMKTIIHDTISLPFFDDFSSGTSVYPDPHKWQDKKVFINDGFAINPPSVGVATFDGIDSIGIPYANTNLEYSADTLTSQYINLNAQNYAADTTIYLSFFYQSAGNGNTPDDGDSLILQFKYYDDTAHTYNWITVWEVNGQSLSTPFQQVFVHVNDSIFHTFDSLSAPDSLTFFTNNFQFRFLNLASGYGDIDIWNLDYVLLNNHRSTNDTTMIDMAFVNEPQSLLKNFSAMPWTHYCVDSINEMASNYQVTIRNNDNLNHLVCFTTTIDTPNSIIYTFPLSGQSCYNLAPQHDSTITAQISLGNPGNFYFPPHPGDWAQFNIKHFLAYTSGDNDTTNDTLRYLQRFSDYYAYDDGTAELGYGTWGYGAELAMQFTTTKADTLRGVYMFFNQMVDNVSLDLFALTIWSDIQINGTGSTTQYSQYNMAPMYDTGSLEAFHYYVLDTPQFIPKGTFYVGWVQDISYEALLNIGLDMNSNWDSTRLFYNTNGTWYPSTLPGTVMIRPVFGASATITGIKSDNSLSNSVDIYPNPANNAIYLKWTSKDYIPSSDLITEIYDPAGRLILTQTGYQDEINISTISEGFYFVKMSDRNSNSSFTRKLVISR